MIGYRVSLDTLNDSIDDVNATWRARATQRTEELEQGTRQNITGMWSEIKQVFMDIQGPKCAFCEKWIEDQAIEQDVEHFRPKNNVKRWRVPSSLSGEGINITQPASGSEPGYRLLAYNPQNYVTACKTCNSVLKRDYYPIAGTRDSASKDPANMATEEPYLIFPIGDFDDDPEDLIEFYGLSPRPKGLGFARKRALVTIVLFKLDDVQDRKELLRDRAQSIEYLYFALWRRDSPESTGSEVAAANEAIERLIDDGSRHANCLRCFKRLWESNEDDARAIYSNVADFLRSISP